MYLPYSAGVAKCMLRMLVIDYETLRLRVMRLILNIIYGGVIIVLVY